MKKDCSSSDGRRAYSSGSILNILYRFWTDWRRGKVRQWIRYRKSRTWCCHHRHRLRDSICGIRNETENAAQGADPHGHRLHGHDRSFFSVRLAADAKRHACNSGSCCDSGRLCICNLDHSFYPDDDSSKEDESKNQGEAAGRITTITKHYSSRAQSAKIGCAFSLPAPYSEERRRAASEAAKKSSVNGMGRSVHKNLL